MTALSCCSLGLRTVHVYYSSKYSEASTQVHSVPVPFDSGSGPERPFLHKTYPGLSGLPFGGEVAPFLISDWRVTESCPFGNLFLVASRGSRGPLLTNRRGIPILVGSKLVPGPSPGCLYDDDDNDDDE